MVFSTFSLLAMTMNASILFSWDARGRLHAITERDASNSGYNWTATYDALNRRLSTTSILVTNGVAFTSQPNTINSYFDPQKEFLELGVNYGGTTEFKLYGPDLNGVYGGLNGIGGLDAVSPGLNLFEPTISDFRGNVLGVVTNSAVVWNPSRPTGFGAVPGYQPVALGNGADIVVSSAWRGRWADITGYYNIGLRPYDPISGRWLTYDSVWNEIDPSGMTFCGGDPVNSVDSDGRLAANGPDNSVQNLNFGTMAVMNTYLQTTRYLSDGSIVINGYPGDNGSVFDPSMWGYSSYTTIRTDTGLSQFFVSESPLPSDYSQTTWTPITTWDVEQQKDTEGAIFLAESILMLDTGTGEFAPEVFGTETTAAETAGPEATGFLGSKNFELGNAVQAGDQVMVQGTRNVPTVINDVNYSGHALDQMQNRGIMPSVVENTMNVGTQFPTRAGTVGYFDSVNNVRVIVNSQNGTVVTVIRGAP